MAAGWLFWPSLLCWWSLSQGSCLPCSRNQRRQPAPPSIPSISKMAIAVPSFAGWADHTLWLKKNEKKGEKKASSLLKGLGLSHLAAVYTHMFEPCPLWSCCNPSPKKEPIVKLLLGWVPVCNNNKMFKHITPKPGQQNQYPKTITPEPLPHFKFELGGTQLHHHPLGSPNSFRLRSHLFKKNTATHSGGCVKTAKVLWPLLQGICCTLSFQNP